MSKAIKVGFSDITSVTSLLDTIVNVIDEQEWETLTNMRDRIEEVQNQLQEFLNKPISNNTQLSSSATHICQVCRKVKNLLIAKNADYGDSAFKPPILLPNLSHTTAIQVRISDKLERLIHLQEHEPQVVSESAKDTLMDLTKLLQNPLISLKISIQTHVKLV